MGPLPLSSVGVQGPVKDSDTVTLFDLKAAGKSHILLKDDRGNPSRWLEPEGFKDHHVKEFKVKTVVDCDDLP